MNSSSNKKKNDPMICLCNSVNESEIVKAIEQGARSLDEIFDLSQAGVGACGGSCRPKLQKILDRELKRLKS